MKITKAKGGIRVYEDGLDLFFDRKNGVRISEAEESISSPGEYEFALFGLILVETKKDRNNVADLYKIDYEGVNLLVKAGKVEEITKEDLDLLGEVNALIVFGDDQEEEVIQIIKKIAPQMVIINEYEKATIENELNVQIATEEKTIKLKRGDFQESDSAQKYIGLVD